MLGLGVIDRVWGFGSWALGLDLGLWFSFVSFGAGGEGGQTNKQAHNEIRDGSCHTRCNETWLLLGSMYSSNETHEGSFRRDS